MTDHEDSGDRSGNETDVLVMRSGSDHLIFGLSYKST